MTPPCAIWRRDDDSTPAQLDYRPRNYPAVYKLTKYAYIWIQILTFRLENWNNLHDTLDDVGQVREVREIR